MNNNEIKFDSNTSQLVNQSNNNEIRFDPNTGQPINQINNIQQNSQEEIMEQMNQIQNIPTVDQNKQEFINNTQTLIDHKKGDKNEGPNYALIIILFIIIFGSIFFLFPLLIKYI